MQQRDQISWDINTNDPKIEFTKEVISLIPSYWNVPLVTSIAPILIFAIPIFAQNEVKYDLIFSVLIIALLFITAYQLTYYNTIIINKKNKTILVIPNLFLRPFFSKKIIHFEDVKTLKITTNTNTGGFTYIDKRYILTLVLKSSKKIKLISTCKSVYADTIRKQLLLLFN